MIYSLPNDSWVAVHDIFDPLPSFMGRADVLFTDIPYNQAMLTNYSRREGVTISPNNPMKFDAFLQRFVQCVKQISPTHCFVETGKEALFPLHATLAHLFRGDTFYNSTYYHKQENKSYILHFSNDPKRRRFKELEDLDEADAIDWIARNVDYRCIGDLCMGRGLVGLSAYAAGKPFVGTELNPRRLAVLLQRLAQQGASVHQYRPTV